MKFSFLAVIAVLSLAMCSCTSPATDDNRLVILHTNDTHSQIEPGSDGLGGVLRRKAVIDSVREAERNVLVVDAGDAVQGTLYFYLYGGLVEQEILNILGVDVRILGNHEFDNGIDSLAAVLKHSKAVKISSNYDLSATPLRDQFEPYVIKEYGGKRIGIIGINLEPKGMIAEGNYDGLGFLPIIASANLTAQKLREEKDVDAVVALTHIGYKPAGLVGDSLLAINSRNIDVIIGGHSHDLIDPTTAKGQGRAYLRNLDGKPILVVQTGKSGRYLGKVEINLDSLGGNSYPGYELIRIDERLDGTSDAMLESTIATYRSGVDSLMSDYITYAMHDMSNSEPELLNFFADYIYSQGRELASDIDLSIVNKGALRISIPEGKVSKGQIINLLPFRNFIVVIELSGKDLRDAFAVMARRNGDGVSRNVSVVYEPAGEGDVAEIDRVLINGRPIDDKRTYRVATIDYLAKGGDYMTPLTHGKEVARSQSPLFDDLQDYFINGAGKDKAFEGDRAERWHRKK